MSDKNTVQGKSSVRAAIALAALSAIAVLSSSAHAREALRHGGIDDAYYGEPSLRIRPRPMPLPIQPEVSRYVRLRLHNVNVRLSSTHGGDGTFFNWEDLVISGSYAPGGAEAYIQIVGHRPSNPSELPTFANAAAYVGQSGVFQAYTTVRWVYNQIWGYYQDTRQALDPNAVALGQMPSASLILDCPDLNVAAQVQSSIASEARVQVGTTANLHLPATPSSGGLHGGIANAQLPLLPGTCNIVSFFN